MYNKTLRIGNISKPTNQRQFDRFKLGNMCVKLDL